MACEAGVAELGGAEGGVGVGVSRGRGVVEGEAWCLFGCVFLDYMVD